MLPERIDSVHNIHKRWSFTRINPSSYKASFLISIASAIVIIIVAHIDVINTKALPFTTLPSFRAFCFSNPKFPGLHCP